MVQQKIWHIIHPQSRGIVIVLLIVFTIASIIIFLGTFSPITYDPDNIAGTTMLGFCGLVYGLYGISITNHSNNTGQPQPDKNINGLPFIFGLLMGGVFLSFGFIISFYFSTNVVLMSWRLLHFVYGSELISVSLGVYGIAN